MRRVVDAPTNRSLTTPYPDEELEEGFTNGSAKSALASGAPQGYRLSGGCRDDEPRGTFLLSHGTLIGTPSLTEDEGFEDGAERLHRAEPVG